MSDPPVHRWTPEQSRAFWDWESRHPERFFATTCAPELVRRVRRHLAGREAILDYGSGAGALVDELLRRGYRVAGSDASPAAVEALRRRLDGHPRFLGAFRSEDLLAADAPRFDAIFATEVVEHLYDDWLDALLHDLRRIVRPGGRIVFTTPNDEDLTQEQLACPCCGKPFHRWQHVRSWSRESLTAHLEARGFRTVEAFTADFSLTLSRPGKRIGNARKKFKYWRKPHKKRPQLAVVCSVDPDAGA
jgi:2-polyprenyl-3-methyl-5-hydroxy-6-metoxy-1,4-benzoquinol methylase